jgi:tRNA nucleotidyltransferase (CCA-adding enzyme)
MNKTNTIKSNVVKILNKLNKYGEGVLVGGSMRDIYLGIYPKDYDFATNIQYEELLKIFKDYNPKEIGKAFGIIQITMDGDTFEISKYRKDGIYSDGRHPDNVIFMESFHEDCSRRDFNINAIGWDGVNIYDFFGGVESLKNKTFSAIGDPEKRLKEDPLRMMRAIRISITRDLTMSQSLFLAIKENAKLINTISKERIKDEFDKILLSPNCSKGLKLLNRTGLLEYIIPELHKTVGFNQDSKFHTGDLFNHLIRTMKNTKPIIADRLAGLFHDIGKMNTMKKIDGKITFYGHEAESSKLSIKILREIKYDSKTIEKVSILIENHMNKNQLSSEKASKRLLARVGEENIYSLLQLMKADIEAHKPPYNFKPLNRLIDTVERVIRQEEIIKVKQMPISGKDVMNILNIKQGKKIGVILDAVLEICIDNPKTSKEECVAFLIKNKDNWTD